MTLTEKLNSYGAHYWDFSQYRENTVAVKYPAMMVAPMQKEIIEDILDNTPQISNVLDPFVGSGTVLSAGAKLGLNVTGIDINPLAILLTRVRLEGVEKDSIRNSIARLHTNIILLAGNVNLHSFCNISKWFRQDVISDLSIIREAIIREHDVQIRRFFWICMSDTVRKFSNSRSTTFKLHIKEERKIADMENDSIEYFIGVVSKAYSGYFRLSENEKIMLHTGDSIEVLSKFESKSFDLICTSPPYGDNHTTVTYGQYSILPLLWIDNKDLDPYDVSLTSKFSAIDRMSLGGRNQPHEESTVKDLIENVSEEKSKKVVSFCHDYEQTFMQMARVLKTGSRMVLTLGNRRVDNTEIPFDVFNDRLAKKYGLRNEVTITRNIQGKRMPTRLSCIKNHGSVESISREYVKIYIKMDCKEQ